MPRELICPFFILRRDERIYCAGMRRIALLTAAASAALAALPMTAPAANPCLSSPSVETCEAVIAENDVVGDRYSAIKHYAENPEDIIVCVRECGPPTD